MKNNNQKNTTHLEKGTFENSFLVKGYYKLVSPWFKPMVNKPNILFLVAFFATLCGYLLFLLLTFSPSIDKNYEWLTLVFSSDRYIMTLLPFLLGVASVVNKNNTPTVMIRTKNRLHQLSYTLCQQYLAGLALIIVWFIAACVFSRLVLSSLFQTYFNGLMLTFIYFFLYYIAMVNVATFLNRTSVKLLKRGSYAILYIVTILAQVFLPQIHFISTHKNVTFEDYLMGIIIPCVVIVIFTFLLRRISSKADLV